MRAIAFGLIFVGTFVPMALRQFDQAKVRPIDIAMFIAWPASLVATLVCIIGGW